MNLKSTDRMQAILTRSDISNLLIMLNKTSYEGLTEAKVGVVLEAKLQSSTPFVENPTDGDGEDKGIPKDIKGPVGV